VRVIFRIFFSGGNIFGTGAGVGLGQRQGQAQNGDQQQGNQFFLQMKPPIR
jgi:hypothetical protein